MPLLILGCSMRKHVWHQPVPFASVYAGPLWTIARASNFPRASLLAISAKHGVLAGDDLIMHYDEAPDQVVLSRDHAVRLAALVEADGEAFMFASRIYTSAVQMWCGTFPALHRIVMNNPVGMLAMNAALSAWLVDRGYKARPQTRAADDAVGRRLKSSLGHGR